MKATFLLGRAILGGFFLYNGIHHFMELNSMSKYAAAKKVPMADMAVAASGAMLLLGGASLITGIKPKAGTSALVGFLLGVSPVIHDFWNIEDPQQKQNEMINFSKNLALLGATVALGSVEEPWPASLAKDNRTAIKKVRDFAKRGRRVAA